MPRSIDREGVRRMLAEGAQLVEVLPRKEYEEQHIAGAINLPLRELDSESAAKLDPARPVITYCDDFQ
jgi:rhodanese-related sulfurtransferase